MEFSIAMPAQHAPSCMPLRASKSPGSASTREKLPANRRQASRLKPSETGFRRVLTWVSSAWAMASIPVCALIGFAFLPFASGWAVVVHPYSFLFFTAFASLTMLVVFAAGWSSNNKWALFGTMRTATQLVSYEIPIGVAFITVVAAAGSFSLVDVVDAHQTVMRIVKARQQVNQ